MSVRLRIGNSLDGQHPSKAVIREFRAGQRELSEYTFKTLPLDKISPNFTGSKEITVNEVKRFFDRKTQPRMTTGATMFANLRDVDEEKWYSRVPDERMYGDYSDSLRAYGASSLADESIGLKFKVYRVGGDHSTQEAYFDNSRLEVSNILWEFSADGGNKWYQLYDLPNRVYTRITLPQQTTRLKARALSNDLEDWVQSFAITPKPNFQKIGNETTKGIGVISSLTISEYGYLKWDDVTGSVGNVTYEVHRKIDDKDKLLATVTDNFYQLEEFDIGEQFYVVAIDELGNRSISNTVTYNYDDVPYRWINYNLYSYRNSSKIDENEGTFTDKVDGLTYVYGPAGYAFDEVYYPTDDEFMSYDEATETLTVSEGVWDRFTLQDETDGPVLVTQLEASDYSGGVMNGFESEQNGTATIDNAYDGKEIDRYKFKK